MPDQVQVIATPSAQQVRQLSHPLHKILAVFPFDFFPDEVVLDRFKVDVVRKQLFGTERVRTFPLSGNLMVTVTKNPFFASMEIKDMATNTISTVRYLSPQKALYMRQLIMGMVMGIRQGINFNQLSDNEVVMTILELGRVDE
jgi:hypothetical protein